MRALDTAAVRAWAGACVQSLQALRADIDGINVYPVADADTGTNLLHTLTAARAALTETAELDGAGQALEVFARAAVRAARGNSGTIMSQVLRGMAESARDLRELDGRALASALRNADLVATGAVARPVAGTMLSVLHAAAASAGEGELDEVATNAVKAAEDALARTPEQLAALAVAGVVDAGGRGLVVVLDALVDVITGSASASASATDRTDPATGSTVEPEPAVADVAVPEPDPPRAWEVMYLLSGVAEAELSVLRRALSALGDSVTVAADGAGEHAVHVHCADIGAAIEAGLRHGRPHGIRVEPLMSPAPVETGAAEAERAVVAVVHGAALAELVAAEGAPVLPVAAGREPSAEELLGLITETGARHVTVLPGDVALTAAAERICGHPMLADLDVVVVPCASAVQVLAALAVHDPRRRAGADVVAMAEAAAATHRGDIAVARQESITWVGRAQAGDLVGMVDGEVVLIESSSRVADAAVEVLERMLAVGGELVTVLTGAEAPEGIAEVLADRLRATHPEVELVCYPGGQTDTLLLMGVE